MGEHRSGQLSRPRAAFTIAALLLALAVFSAATQLAGFWRIGGVVALAMAIAATGLVCWSAGYRARQHEERDWRTGSITRW